MRCPLCGRDLRVMKTIDEGFKVIRKRQCLDYPKCPYTAYPEEILPEYWDTPDGRNQRLRSQKRQ